MDKSQYEIVRFSTKITNTTTTKSGYRINNFLVVSWADERKEDWRIYRSQDGLECLRTTFETSDDAILFAEWLCSVYGEFFFIWTEYPNAELFRWTYLTVEKGEEYWKMLEALENKRKVRWKDVLQYLN
jgi:hypothetical protein